MTKPGQIIILNGAPRSGKSSSALAIQATFEGVWINLGVDSQIASLPERYRPGIGLRPGGERPDLEFLIPTLYAALYESIASHSRLGLNVVVDVGHHDCYSRSLDILTDSARRLEGLPVLFIGIRCPIDVIMARRKFAEGRDYLTGSFEEPVPAPVMLWQNEVHKPGIYDLEVDTSQISANECAALIRRHLGAGLVRPTAFERLAMDRVSQL